MRRLLIAAAAVLAAPILALAGEARPVMVGGNDGLDACMTLAQVNPGLHSITQRVEQSPDDGNNGPAAYIRTGQQLWICEETDDYYGIVFGRDGNSDADCGVTSPIEVRTPYEGECLSGWIIKAYIDVLAG